MSRMLMEKPPRVPGYIVKAETYAFPEDLSIGRREWPKMT